METSLILFIIGFLVVAFLILKFIKKVILAVFSVFIAFLLMIGGVIGLVYLDINHLTSGEEYEIQVVLADGDVNRLGVSVPLENMSLDVESIEGISEFNLDNLNVKDVKKDDKLFVLIIQQDTLEDIMVKEVYDLQEVVNLDLPDLADLDLTLSRDEVLEILNSKGDGFEEVVDIFLSKNEFPEILANVIKGSVESEFREMLEDQNLNIKELLFLVVLSEEGKTKEGSVKLFEAFKEKELRVYPDRLTFKVLRWLPVSTINNLVSGNLENS